MIDLSGVGKRKYLFLWGHLTIAYQLAITAYMDDLPRSMQASTSFQRLPRTNYLASVIIPHYGQGNNHKDITCPDWEKPRLPQWRREWQQTTCIIPSAPYHPRDLPQSAISLPFNDRASASPQADTEAAVEGGEGTKAQGWNEDQRSADHEGRARSVRG